MLERINYVACYASIAYRHTGHQSESARVLESASSIKGNHGWTYDLVKFLQGQTTLKKLIELAGKDQGRRTEAEFLAGVNDLLSNREQDGLQHLRWVEAHGSKGFYEYDFALTELNKPSTN